MSKHNIFDFYLQMTPFRDFAQITHEGCYHPVPSDWHIVMTDIRGSTEAVKRGQSKEVNLIGVAAIVVYCNLVGSQEVPFTFGGDGATMIVPDSLLKDFMKSLLALKKLAAESFQLELRVGSVPVAKIREVQSELLVAKYELSPGNYLAQFKGGGLTVAEEWFKKKDLRADLLERSKETSEPATSLNNHLKGLSCRLLPLKSVNGKILTLLCKPSIKQDPFIVLNRLFTELQGLLGNTADHLLPLGEAHLRWPFPPRRVSLEAHLSSEKRPFFLTWLFVFIYAAVSNLSLSWGFRMGSFLPSKYKKELRFNSDFRKFDETLRMVLDCTPVQIEQIRKVLTRFEEEGLLTFGLHLSDSALMTCFVESPTNNRHIHFIDGNNGGYTSAAVELKTKLRNYENLKQSVHKGS